MTQAEKDVVLSLRQQHYSFSAIAQTTGLPLGTIKSFLSVLVKRRKPWSRWRALQRIKPAADSVVHP